MSGSQLLLLGGTPQVVSDPNFEYTTLLLPGNGTNGAQNNTFLDSSTNAFSITRNGNTTQGTFSPFSQTGWGAYFNGGTSCLTFTKNASTSSVTLECWFYFTENASIRHILFGGDNSNSANNCQFAVENNGAIFVSINAGASLNVTTSSGVVPKSQWNHIAFVRNGSAWTFYVNGTSVGTGTSAAAINVDRIGDVGAAGATPVGYISNARIVDSAVYTSTFTPSTTPLTAISNTYLLTLQSNRYVDNSGNARAITVSGTTISIQAFSPFNPTAAWSAATNGGSGYFDGSGDFLSAPDNAALEPGSSNLTWEMWINTTTSTQYATLYSRTPAAFTTGMWSLMINLASSTAGDVALFVGDFSAGSPLLQTTGVSVRDNAWHHIAVVRNGSSWVLYVDGVSRATATWSGTIADIAGGPYVGRDQFYGRDYVGYMSDLRIVKGTAVYTANFTPPTAPLTAIANTSLLLNYTNAGIFDATSKNDLETVGNAQISTTQSKFGGSSMYFDGSGDGLAMPSAPLLQLGSGDFTVEAWVYFSGNLPYQDGDGLYSAALFGQQASSGLVIQFRSATSSAPTSIYYTVIGVGSASVAFSFSLNTWYHVAVSRNAGTARIFVNGNQITSFASTTNLAQSTTQIGWLNAANFNQYFLGYIDDVRVTKGVARYTANFTAPTAAFPLL